jgi:transglutaminase-like putative cysteine protease
MKLRGTAFDVYESQNWTVSEEFENEVIDYSEELRRKTEFLDSYNVNYTEFFIEVEHNVYSKVLYTPTDSYIFDNEYDIKSSISNFFYTTEELDKNAIYTVSTIKIDKYSVAFTSMMKSLEAGNISDKYLQLPDEFSEEVINLAQDITSEYDSVYEKALAIENYLSANHKYNLSPDEKPYYYDYVEFFLFKSQEGFCTHYASSMVTMLRSVGIPSRYVIGYVLDRDGLGSVNRGSEEDETFEGVERRYLITKRKSHAWVEVYFEGYGWLEFEPTTPYFRTSTNTEIVIDLPKDPITPDEPEIEEKSYLIQTVTAIIVGLILGLGAFFKFKPNHTTDQKIVKVWNKIEKVIRKHRRVDDTNLTARELLNEARLKDTKLLMALSIYEKACYSNQVCSENELEQMKDTLDYYKSLQKD